MTLTVHTARVSYSGPDRFDITAKSGGDAGEPFAPSWKLLAPLLAMRRAGSTITEAHWRDYVERYTDEMRRSYVGHRASWDALLARAEVTLVCYCTDAARCHRAVLGGILVKLGATYAGERA